MSRPLLAEPSKRTAYMREWRAAHPENRDYQKAYHTAYRADPEKAELGRQRARAWGEANRERVRARVAKWQAENPERYRAHHFASTVRRRARLLGATVGPIDFDALLSDANGTCALCGGELGGAWHFDHIVPLSKGGAHAQENLQVVHPACNQRKGARL